MAVRNLLVLGSVNIDEVYSVQDIVKPGETITSLGVERNAGGKGANVSVAIAKAGSPVSLAGHVGQDGESLKQEIAGYGVDVSLLTTVQEVTGKAIIQVSQSGENSIVLFRGANHHPESALSSTFDCSQYAVLVLQNEIPLAHTIQAIELARKQGLQTVFNPSPMPSLEERRLIPWSSVDWLIVNQGELAEIAGDPSTDSTEDLTRLVARLAARLNIIVTLGSQGAVVYSSGTFIRSPAGRVGRIVDTTGAGDCFLGYFAAALANGLPTHTEIKAAVDFAQQAAAISVESKGAMVSMPTADQVHLRLQEMR